MVKQMLPMPPVMIAGTVTVGFHRISHSDRTVTGTVTVTVTVGFCSISCSDRGFIEGLERLFLLNFSYGYCGLYATVTVTVTVRVTVWSL